MINQTKKPMLDLWKSYQQMVLPPDAPSIQITETKRAFYAGAGGLISLLEQKLSPGLEATEEDVRYLELIKQELEAFSRSVLTGEN